MKDFLRSFRSELLKLKRSPALLVTLVGPYLVVALFFVFALAEGKRLFGNRPGPAWEWLLETSFTTWTFALFPLSLGLVTALAAAVEHHADGFRHLYALSVSRQAIYQAKQAVGWLLAALSYALLAVGVLGAGFVLRFFLPGVGLEAAPPWDLLGRLVVLPALGSAFLVSIQTWISLVRREFATPVALAVLGTVSMLTLRAVGASLLPFHPWAFPGEAARGALSGSGDPAWWLLGLGSGIAFSACPGWSHARRDVP